MKKIKVGINGAGTVGKRVLEAVAKQDDMKIVGYTKTKPDYTSKNLKKYKLYTNFPENFEDSDTEVKGSLSDLIDKADIIIDATDKRGDEYKKIYQEKGIKAIFQGGEKKHIGKSFVAQCNYEDILGEDYVRCVSCNTTGLSRVLNAIDKKYSIKQVDAQLIRRSADPKDSKKGPTSQIVPVIKTDEFKHGHHGPDVNTVLPDIDIHTMAVAVPSSLMHVHILQVEVHEEVTIEEIIETLENTDRVMLIEHKNGFKSTGDVMEYAKYIDRKIRGDLQEVAVWKDSISIEGNKIRFYQAVHQESIVVPENVDAIRAMFKLMPAEESIEKTNESLEI